MFLLSYQPFRYAFANEIGEDEAGGALYERDCAWQVV